MIIAEAMEIWKFELANHNEDLPFETKPEVKDTLKKSFDSRLKLVRTFGFGDRTLGSYYAEAKVRLQNQPQTA